jgi:uncharacterized cupredoxin-like copper-binding protein
MPLTTHRHALALPAAAAAVLAAAVVATGCGSNNSNAQTPPPPKTTAATTPATTAPPAKGTVDATLGEWSVKLSSGTVPAGTVKLHVTDAGTMQHELVVLKTSKQAGELGKAGQSRIAETGHVGEVGNLDAGKSGDVTLHLKPGHYSLVCNLPGHYIAGMHVDLTVQ